MTNDISVTLIFSDVYNNFHMFDEKDLPKRVRHLWHEIRLNLKILHIRSLLMDKTNIDHMLLKALDLNFVLDYTVDHQKKLETFALKAMT